MNTEHIISGKNNPHVYPDLEIWGFPIALYKWKVAVKDKSC